jgi:hypothetical protein
MKEKRPPQQQSGFFLSHTSTVYGGHTLTHILTVGDGRSSFLSKVHYTKMSSTREGRRSDPHDNSQDSSSLIYGGHSLTESHTRSRNRLKVNPLHISSNDIKRPMFCRNVDSFPFRQISGARYVLFLAKVMPKFSVNFGITCARK